MEPAFVKIGNLYINLHTLVWAQMDFHNDVDVLILILSTGGELRLRGQEAHEMRRILDQLRPSQMM